MNISICTHKKSTFLYTKAGTKQNAGKNLFYKASQSYISLNIQHHLNKIYYFMLKNKTKIALFFFYLYRKLKPYTILHS